MEDAVHIIKKHIDASHNATHNDSLKNSRTVFVFPSEITAHFWLKKAFDYTVSTIPGEQFISWDEFKETATKYSSDRPVNNAIRTLFTCCLLEENRENQFFRKIINPDYASNSLAFLKSIRNILPTLSQLKNLDLGWPGFEEAKKKDLNILLERYEQFLTDHDLFEPNFQKPELVPGNKHYILFFPDVIEDYTAYEALISAHPGTDVIRIKNNTGAAELPKITAFETSPLEIKWVMNEIGRLLDEHVDPEDIVLTVANLEAMEPVIRRQAELYEIPLKIHIGKHVSLYPEARLFGQIRECVESGFSLQALKYFLLNYSIPWKEISTARDLIRFGIDHKSLLNVAGSSRSNSLKRLQDFYEKLISDLNTVYSSSDFFSLKQNLMGFSKRFLVTSKWNENELKVFQFALNTIDAYAEASKILPHSPDTLPFILWLKNLDERIYVKRDTSCGIPVYPYRVASGVYPQFHFIINASHNGTDYIIKRFPFLSIHEEENLTNTELDLSDRLIRLYLNSGKKVFFSYSKRNYSGSCLPPSFFVTQGSIQAFKQEDCKQGQDLFERELLSWTGDIFPEKIFGIQKNGFSQAQQAILKEKSDDYTKIPIEKNFQHRIVKRYARTGDCISISPTSLEIFQSCPFQSLLEKGLKIEELDYELIMMEPWEVGSIMHKVFQNFFEKIMNTESRLYPEKIEQYRNMIRESVESVFFDYERYNPVPIQPIWMELRRKVENLSLSYIDCEIELMPEWETIHTEEGLEFTWSEQGIRLSGKIDRISRYQNKYTLIDYKKKNFPSREDIFGTEPVSFQMPFYTYLMNKNGMEVNQAAYYSIEKNSYTFVFSACTDQKVFTDIEGMGQAIEGLKHKIRDMAERIHSGDFTINNDARVRGCTHCSFMKVCRNNFKL